MPHISYHRKMFLYIIATVASLGGLLYGFDTGVISGALLFINNTWQMSSLEQGWLVSSVIVGSVLGAGSTGFLADLYGRKKIIIITALLFTVGSLLCGVAQSITQLISARILVGYAIGMVSFAVPLYLSELSPQEVRGRLVALFQLAITAGILLSYLSNSLFADTHYSWRWMLGSGIFPAIILLIGILFLSDTPRWLISQNREAEAQVIFQKIMTPAETKAQIAEIHSNLAQTQSSHKLVFKKWFIMPIFVGVGIMFAQICTGINTIIYFAPSVFKAAGFASHTGALYATVGVGLINFILTFVAIATIDKFGRKPLLYIGLTGMLISLLVLSASFAWSQELGEFNKWIAVIAILTYIAFFAMSLGPVGWILVSEIMPQQIRGLAMSIATVSNFGFNFIVALSFLSMLNSFGGSITFLIFATVTVISLLFVYFFVPETKGISLETIEKNWQSGISARKF